MLPLLSIFSFAAITLFADFRRFDAAARY
jgi:hypothetical protein